MKKQNIFFVFTAVLFLICNSIYAQKSITVEDIWKNYKFYPQSVPGFNTSLNGDFYTVKTLLSIDKYKFVDQTKVSTLLNNGDLKAMHSNLTMRSINSYAFDRTETKMLVSTQMESIYRRSSKAYYYIVDLAARTVKSLSDTALDKQSFATFSPDGSKVAFVRNNNLFVKDLATNTETAVTTDGLDRHIINGMADWVYEEELDMSQCFYWSPDGQNIAFLRFDESRVKEFSFTMYGGLYPQEHCYKYPKAGEDNSIVDVLIYNVNTAQTTIVDMGDNTDCYIPRLYWLPNAQDLVILKMNRHQNQLDFFRYNTISKNKDLIYTDLNDKWLDVTHDYYFLNDNKSMIVTSERDGYNHIYHVVFGGAVTQLTKGNFEVAGICAVDKEKKYIYYLSNESGTLNRDLYRISMNGKDKKMLSNGKGWNNATFSPTCRYYRNVYSDIATPPVYTLNNANGKVLSTMLDNAAYKQLMQEYGFAPVELFSFVSEEGISINGSIIKPLDFDPSKKYPVLMHVYGGPGSQEVSNSFSGSMDFAWYQMLAQKGYIIVCTDGRGTATKGDEFKKCIYKQMGKYEAIDQIATAKYLKTLPYVDGNRIGIWGWSFGGYLSSLAMFTGDGVFKMAMAVAPVTTWRYYDNIYTERYLQTPQENEAGYDDNSPITHAYKLKGNYLLVHGLADDNVHVQNSVDLITALNKAEKQYEQYFYPNKNHGIYGGNTRYHLYIKLTDFVLKNL